MHVVTINPNIKKLSYAAAKLYIAWISAPAASSFDDVVKAAGIQRYDAVMKARKQLEELGFVGTPQPNPLQGEKGA